jgi:hypothetical protein
MHILHDYGIEGDSLDYEILKKAAADIENVDGLTCEIGVRLGMGSLTIMKETSKHENKKIHIGIDPFGNIEYQHGDTCRCPSCESGWHNSPANYTNKLKRRFLNAIYTWCYANDAEFMFFPFEDTEFFNRFSDGVPTYINSEEINDSNYKNLLGNKKLYTEYALVHIDGPHDYKTVQNETNFFINRIAKGGYIVYDDVQDYEHQKIDQQLKENGFVAKEYGQRKISYKKVA